MDYIPIVDFSKLSQPESEISENDWKITGKEIFEALSGIGFVYLKNHGIENEIISNAFNESKKFFELPEEIKRQSLKDVSKSYNGYGAIGQETLHPDTNFEIRESYDVGGNKRYFPDQIAPEFELAVTCLEKACKPLIKQLLRVMAKSLNLDDLNFFVNRASNIDDLNVESYSTLRQLYYPPTWNKNITPGTVRCGDHSDYGILTLLFQDSIGGLEVLSVSGKWLSADPVPNTVLVNTGDLLEFWSDGIFPATHHRILIPEKELQQKSARQSIAYFIHPDDNVIVEPFKNISTSSSDYQPITAKEHAKRRLEASYNY